MSLGIYERNVNRLAKNNKTPFINQFITVIVSAETIGSLIPPLAGPTTKMPLRIFHIFMWDIFLLLETFINRTKIKFELNIRITCQTSDLTMSRVQSTRSRDVGAP